MSILLLFLGFLILLFIILFIIMASKIRKLSAESRNKVHFYVTRDKDGDLTIWMGKPKRALFYGIWYGTYNKVAYIFTLNKGLPLYGLNPKDFDNLKWEDEPVEVFLNLGE